MTFCFNLATQEGGPVGMEGVTEHFKEVSAAGKKASTGTLASGTGTTSTECYQSDLQESRQDLVLTATSRLTLRLTR